MSSILEKGKNLLYANRIVELPNFIVKLHHEREVKKGKFGPENKEKIVGFIKCYLKNCS
jgi:hypothetical protein